MEAIDGVELSGVGIPSLILRDLSEFSTLPFIAAFDIPDASAAGKSPGTPSKQGRDTRKRVTYIALSKKAMPLLVDMFLRFKDNTDIYVDGTVEAIFSVSYYSCNEFGCIETCAPGVRHPNQIEV